MVPPLWCTAVNVPVPYRSSETRGSSSMRSQVGLGDRSLRIPPGIMQAPARALLAEGRLGDSRFAQLGSLGHRLFERATKGGPRFSRGRGVEEDRSDRIRLIGRKARLPAPAAYRTSHTSLPPTTRHEAPHRRSGTGPRELVVEQVRRRRP